MRWTQSLGQVQQAINNDLQIVCQTIKEFEKEQLSFKLLNIIRLYQIDNSDSERKPQKRSFKMTLESPERAYLWSWPQVEPDLHGRLPGSGGSERLNEFLLEVFLKVATTGTEKGTGVQFNFFK